MSRIRNVIVIAACAFALLAAPGCGFDANVQSAPQGTPGQVSSSRAKQQNVSVQTDASGWTVEQRNVARRLKDDNTPGSTKYLYVLSPLGKMLFYSSVEGKVTSSGKRLNPGTVAAGATGVSGYQENGSVYRFGIPTANNQTTTEVQNDDGTYGHSAEYIYWWDMKGGYHQLFVGGNTVLVNSLPIKLPDDVIILDQSKG